MIARYTQEGERTLLTDALGSVILAAKEDQSVQTAYGYSPYGESQVMGTDEQNPIQYTARENDNTGLYYYRARYYDPQLKQWISEDPIGVEGGLNLYTYVQGNPISYMDPDGLNPLARGAAAGAKKLRDALRDTNIDGPSPGLSHGNGRVCQIRYKKKPIFRMDYQPIPGSNNESRLHVHIPPNMNKHYSIDPRSFGD